MDREEAIIRLEQILDLTNIPKNQMALQMAIDDMREQEEQKWIPVTERLPEKNNKWVTNAQKIRSMSDEELAVFVRSIIIAEDCPAPGCDCDKCFFKEPCFNGSKWHGKEIEWLKQPAE